MNLLDHPPGLAETVYQHTWSLGPVPLCSFSSEPFFEWDCQRAAVQEFGFEWGFLALFRGAQVGDRLTRDEAVRWVAFGELPGVCDATADE